MNVSKEAIFEARRAINDDNEDCIGLERISKFMCEAIVPPRLYGGDNVCPREARFRTKDGKRLCQIHAEIWAAQYASPSSTRGAP